MEMTIKTNGLVVSVEVSVEIYTYLDQAAHKDENLAHEQRGHWDMRELDEYIIANECSHSYILTPEQIACRKETLAEIMAVLNTMWYLHTHLLCARLFAIEQHLSFFLTP